MGFQCPGFDKQTGNIKGMGKHKLGGDSPLK
jgi:hypothetical protein